MLTIEDYLSFSAWDIVPVLLLPLIRAQFILSTPDSLDMNLATNVLHVEVIVVLIHSEKVSVLLELVVD